MKNVPITLIVDGVTLLIEMKEVLKGTYGFIHKRTPAKIKDKDGFLIWDYILWNEITFKSDDGDIWSFFTSPSDKKTKAVWNELVQKYGI